MLPQTTAQRELLAALSDHERTAIGTADRWSKEMAAAKVERRVYPVSSIQLFGVCVTALGQLRAAITHHDVEQDLIVATLGEGSLAPTSELALALRPLRAGQTELAATWRARKRGGDQRLLAVFLDSVDTLIR